MRPALGSERGFTIVEMMVAVVVLLTGALGTLAILDTATHRTRTADDRQKATGLAREVIESAKAIPYRQIEQATFETRLRQDAGIAGEGSPWRVERDGTPYTVEAEVCWVDEPADGLGSRVLGGFCSGSGAGGTEDANSIDFKRVSIEVSWSNGTGRGSVRQSTLVGVRGGEDAPAIADVRLVSPLASPITDTARETATFAVTTTTPATAVVWSINGNEQGNASGAESNWTFNWGIPDDGTYDVAARTIEPSGLTGEPRSMTVVVNRRLPSAPEDFNVGRTEAGVAAHWSASGERDVVGYRVYRQGPGGDEVACELTAETSCVDTAAPAATNGAALEYWVVAVEEVLDVQRESDPSPRVDVNVANQPPNPPASVALSKDAQGNTVLTWEPAAVLDPDAGDYVASYRVYRDGVDDGYITVGGTETSATDTETGGTAHEYWVSAVDSRLGESSLVGPVSG